MGRNEIDLVNWFVLKMNIKKCNTPACTWKETARKRALQLNMSKSFTKYRQLRNSLKNKKKSQFEEDTTNPLLLIQKQFLGLLGAKSKSKVNLPDIRLGNGSV